MLSTVENEWHGIPTFLGLKTIYVNVEKKSKVIADLHVTKTINSSCSDSIGEQISLYNKKESQNLWYYCGDSMLVCYSATVIYC